MRSDRATGYALITGLTRLSPASGIKTPTREVLARSNTVSPHDPVAKVARMKDGRTHLAHKAEHAIDLDSGGSWRSPCTTRIRATRRRSPRRPSRRPNRWKLRTDDRRARDAGRDRRGQGVPQQRHPGRLGRGGHSVVYLGTRPRPARLVPRTRRPSSCLSESPPHARRPRRRRCDGDGRNSPSDPLRICMRRARCTYASARTRQHSETPADSWQRLQPGARDAPLPGHRHAAALTGAARGRHDRLSCPVGTHCSHRGRR